MDFRAGKELVRFAAIGLGTALRRAYSSEDAERFLSQSLGSMPGAPAKMAQLLGMRSNKEIPSPEAMPIGLVKSIIEKESPQLARNLDFISDWALTASLGQTHKASLKSGELIAIKVQYPDVKDHLVSQIDAVFGVAGFSPARKYDFDAASTRSFLRHKLLEETNYVLEADSQDVFFTRFHSGSVIIPRVYREYSTTKILVQSWEDSMTLQSFVEKASALQKTEAASIFTKWLFESMFALSKMHTDLNPTNFGFRLTINGVKVVIYDFGSMEDFSTEQAVAIYRWLTASQSNNEDSIWSALGSLGFSLARLKLISSQMLPLSKTLFKPLLTDGNWRASSWSLQGDLDQILGQDKWWFRTAGPPWFLYFMRSIQGWHHVLCELDCEIDLHELWHPWSEQLRILSLAQPKTFSDQGLRHESHHNHQISKKPSTALRVKVSEGNELIADLTLPATAVQDLENLLPDHVMRRCLEDGIQLDAIRARVLRSNFVAQELFVTEYGSRLCKVWLE